MIIMYELQLKITVTVPSRIVTALLPVALSLYPWMKITVGYLSLKLLLRNEYGSEIFNVAPQFGFLL